MLLPDPADLAAFGSAVRQLLDNPDKAERMGKAAQEHIREHYVGDRHLLRWAQLIDATHGRLGQPGAVRAGQREGGNGKGEGGAEPVSGQ